MNIAKFLLIILLSMSGNSQDIAVGISSKGFKKALGASLTNMLGTKKILSLDKEEVKFGVNLEILNKEKVSETDFLLVYGKHMLNINFDEAFRLGFVLSGLNASVEMGKLDLNLGKAQQRSSRVKIPVSGSINLKKISIEIDKVELDKATLTDKNVSKQRLLIEKLHRLNSIESFDTAEKLELKKAIQIDACIKEQYKVTSDHVNVVSRGHKVNGQNLKLAFKANAIIDYKESTGVVSFEDFSIIDNLSNDNFQDLLNVDFNTSGFELFENRAITDSGKKQLNVNCYNLKGTNSGMREKLIEGMLIPKVQEILSSKVANLIEEKAYPELLKTVEKQKISFKRVFDIKFSPKKVKIDEVKKIEHIIADSFNELIISPKINKISTHNNNVSVEIENSIEIDEKRITCDYSSLENKENCSRFTGSPVPHTFKTDSKVSFNATLLTSIVNKFDDLLLSHYSSKVDLLKDEEGRELLTLKNHDIFVNPVDENTLDLSLLLNVETRSLKKLLKLALINKFQIKNSYWGLKNKFCSFVTKIHWINAYLIPSCIDHAEKFEEYEDLELALDFRIELKKEDGVYRLFINLPSAKEVFKSKYSDTNFKDFYVLKLVHNLLNERDIVIDLNGVLPLGKVTVYKFPGLYKKVLEKIENKAKIKFLFNEEVPYISLPIDLKKINEKSPVEIKEIHLDNGGHFHFDLNFTEKIFNKIPLKNEVTIK